MLLVIIGDNPGIGELKKMISELSSLPDNSWKILVLNYQLRKELRKGNIPYSFIDDYFFEEDHYSDYSQAIDISNKWFFNSSGSDETVYRSISIGVILQGWMTRFFNDFLGNARIVERILKEEKSDEIWLCFSKLEKDRRNFDDCRNFMEIFYVLAKSKNITCKKKFLYGADKKAKLSETIKTSLRKGRSLFYSLTISKMLFLIKYQLMMRKRKNIVNILLPSPQALNYIRTTTIDKLLSDERKNVFIWRGETTRQRASLIDIAQPFFCRIKKSVTETNSRIEKQFNDFVEKNKIGELRNTLGVLKQIYKQQSKPLIKGIISDIEQLEILFKIINVQLVFSHTDTTIRERTVISVSNKYKMPSLVLQHGVTGHYWGFFPLIATKFAAWGEITKSWFERNGVSEGRICITGAANFDSYVLMSKNFEKNNEMYWNGKKDYILYITSFGKDFPNGFKLTKHDNEYLLSVMLDTIETMPERILVIKLKSGDPQTKFYESEIKRRGLKNVYLVDITDNGKLLNACGVLLTTYSTMVIEALFFEKPIIQLKFTNAKNRNLKKVFYSQGIICDEDGIPLARYGTALGVERPEDLKEAILKIYKDESVRKSLINGGKKFLKKYCSEPDGKASLRVIQCIDELILERLS